MEVSYNTGILSGSLREYLFEKKALGWSILGILKYKILKTKYIVDKEWLLERIEKMSGGSDMKIIPKLAPPHKG